ncbi:MAG TPA: RsmG family class I SAM-dependent methyltransferase, partial [Ktedonobacterales bacterium]|nr:RsmG family class I SAM-dependent methyltransferase [Ktedonobacterales bacterium]
MALRALTDGAARLGVPLDARQLAQFARLRALLLHWNTRVNLTAITEPGEVVTKHFLDSLTCVLALPEEVRDAPQRVLDVGAGAGFPGL